MHILLNHNITETELEGIRGKLKQMLLGCCHIEFERMGNVIDYQHKSNECKYC